MCAAADDDDDGYIGHWSSPLDGTETSGKYCSEPSGLCYSRLAYTRCVCVVARQQDGDMM